jgi:SAM-dependent methyltransferase
VLAAPTAVVDNTAASARKSAPPPMRPERLLRGVEKLVTPKKFSYHPSREVIAHFDGIAERWDDYKRTWRFYHAERHRFVCSMIPPGSSVLEVGCATGQLLARLGSGRRIGVDVSPRMIDVARARYPELELHVAAGDALPALEPVDWVILDNLVEYLPDIHVVLDAIRPLLHPFSKLVITSNNPLWSTLINLAHMLGTGTPDIERNFTSSLDLVNLLELCGYDVVESGWRLPFPAGVPLLAPFINVVGPRLPMLRGLGIIEYVIARLGVPPPGDPRASVVIPCFNEVENVGEAIERTIRQPGVAEVVIVDDGSTDGTTDVARGRAAELNGVRVVALERNQGKAAAVAAGFAAATEDIVVILDADLAVAPEELPAVIAIMRAGRAEFVNGSRLVYPMQPGAMKFLNYLGNKFFGIVLSLIMGQRNTDTLCGTKAFFRRYLPHMRLGAAGWGDFDLLFSAARLRLKMVEWPVRYGERRRGTSKMRPFRELWGMLRVCWRGLRDIP